MDDIIDNSKKDPDLLIKSPTIERVRYFIEFETLSDYNQTIEVTVFNEDAEKPAPIIKYDLTEYKPHLKIINNTGEQLEFSKAEEAGKNGWSDYLINIYLPDNKQVLPRHRYTVTLTYVSSHSNSKNCLESSKKNEYLNAYFTDMYFPLPKNINLYLIIKAFKNFDFSEDIALISGNALKKEGKLIPNIEKMLKEERLKIDKIGDRFYLSLKYTNDDIPDETIYLNITHHHFTREPLMRWIQLGGIFGFVSIILIFASFVQKYRDYLPFYSFFYAIFSFFNNLTFIKFNISESNFTTYSIFAITIMFAIRGWLFTKDLDKSLEKCDFGLLIITSLLIIGLILVNIT